MEAEAIRFIIRDTLNDARLPYDSMPRFWGGPADGRGISGTGTSGGNTSGSGTGAPFTSPGTSSTGPSSTPGKPAPGSSSGGSSTNPSVERSTNKADCERAGGKWQVAQTKCGMGG